MFSKMVVMSTTFVLTGFVFPVQCTAQKLVTYQFSEVIRLQQTSRKPMIVFIHTDWCVYCQSMQHSTFRDKRVIEYLNNDFYFFSLDAGEKEDVVFGGQTFRFKPTGMTSGVHELAEAIGKNAQEELIYPTLVIISPKYEIVYQQSGFIAAKGLMNLLNKAKELMDKNK